MGEVTIVVVLNVTHGDDIELLLSTSACGIDSEKNRPCDTATDETADHGNAEESKEEVSIE